MQSLISFWSNAVAALPAMPVKMPHENLTSSHYLYQLQIMIHQRCFITLEAEPSEKTTTNCKIRHGCLAIPLFTIHEIVHDEAEGDQKKMAHIAPPCAWRANVPSLVSLIDTV